MGVRALLLASLAGSSKAGSKPGDELYAAATCEEPGARSRSRSLRPPARPKASRSVQTPHHLLSPPTSAAAQGCGRGCPCLAA